MPNESGIGRPFKDINEKELDNLLKIQCTQEEIASYFECNIDTLCDYCKRVHGMTFSEYSKKKREVGKIALRNTQYQSAVNGNTSLLIWLGKQYLGQFDKQITQTQEIAPFEDLIKSWAPDGNSELSISKQSGPKPLERKAEEVIPVVEPRE